MRSGKHETPRYIFYSTIYPDKASRHRIRWSRWVVGIYQRGDYCMAMKPCPRCKKLMPVGPAYCDTCKPIAEAELERIRERNAQRKAQRYNRKRDPKYRAFYKSKAWRATSRAKLQACEYKCEAKLEGCQGMAVEVHHTEPIQTPRGWERRLDWDNLEGVCTSCHNRRHPEKLNAQHDDGVIDFRTIER